MPRRSSIPEPGEVVICDLRAHWWRLATPVAAVVALLGVGAWAVARPGPRWRADLAGAALLCAAAWMFSRWLRWRAAATTVTSLRLLRRRGVLVRRRREVLLEAVVDVGSRQRLLQRLLRAGDVVVEWGGPGREVLAWVPDPGAVQRDLRRAVEGARRRRIAAVAAELAELDGLRRRGVLSDGEFELEKGRLLR